MTPRNHKLFWGSSYDRGLQHLLDMWPKVKEVSPDAELHICYGWNTFLSFYADNPERLAWKDRLDKLMTQPGIIHHGRLGSKELQTVREDCGIWAYPTHFTEINCMTALEAQKDGCVPVTMTLAALDETVQSGVKIEGDIYDDETKEAYLTALLGLMGDEPTWRVEQQKGVEFTQSLSWELLAKQWAEIIG